MNMEKGKIYQVRSNIVWEVPKLEWDKGIISTWTDKDGENITIQNLDAGNAVELMRIALEDDARGFWRIILYIGAILLVVGIVYFVYTWFSYSDMEVWPLIPIPWEVVEQVPIISQEPLQGTGTTVPIESFNIEEERAKMQADFQYQQLTLEHTKTLQELEKANTYKGLYEEELQKNSDLQKQIEKLSKPADIGKQDFLLKLWQEVYDRCDKLPEWEAKNSCKDLFFNYIKNDNSK